MRPVTFFWIPSSFVAVAAAAGYFYAIVLDGLRSQVIYVPVFLTVCVVIAQITYFREARRKA
jgi:hypothetical protein